MHPLGRPLRSDALDFLQAGAQGVQGAQGAHGAHGGCCGESRKNGDFMGKSWENI